MKDIVIPTLKPEDIEVKVKKVGKSGTQVLLYKTARTDMEYLDSVFGIGNWTCDYKEIKGNLYCTISIWDEDKNQWIPKVDCGIESREDGDGNEKKGEASDAFKRAGFKVGIGRELYSAPFTFIKASDCPTKSEDGKKWFLEDPYTKFEVTDIGYDDSRKINKLIIINKKSGDVVYRFGTSGTTRKQSTKEDAPKKAPEKKAEAKPVVAEAKPAVTVETASTIPNPDMKPHERVFRAFLEKHKIDREKFKELRALAIRGGKNVSQKKFNELSPDEWITLIATMEGLWEEGFFKEVA